jgi:aminoglycoside 3-N-acetyltransferase
MRSGRRMDYLALVKKTAKALGLHRTEQMKAVVRRRVIRTLLRHRFPRYDTAALCDALGRMKLKHGATIFVHSAWDEFFNYCGTPLSLIQALQDYVGPSGTVAMPAFPLRVDASEVFDVRRTPTGAGLIPECFRRLTGVQRSANMFHSVAARGPNADYLVRDHHRSETSWDRFSPYARLADIDAVVLCLGLPASFGLGTLMHCPESLLLNEIPYYRRVFGDPIPYRYRDASGSEGTGSIRPRIGRWRPGRVIRYIAQSEIRVTHVSNLRLQAIDARYLIERMLELARRGIVNYYWPWPWRSMFGAHGSPSAD